MYVQEGQELIQEKPELRSVVQQKLEEIRECWSDLESTTKAKARQLFENNKPEPAVKSYSDLDNQLSHLEQQPPQLEQAHHLPTFNEQLQKFQVNPKAGKSQRFNALHCIESAPETQLIPYCVNFSLRCDIVDHSSGHAYISSKSELLKRQR